MLSNHNPHRTCKGFHHRHSLSLMQKNGEGKRKKNYIDLFLPPFQAFPFPPRSLSSTFVDKSHICVPFWRLLIVLNRRNYSQGVVAAAVQRCWWPGCCVSLCKVLPCVSSTSNILLWPPTARPIWATPLGSRALRLRLTSTAPGLIFIFSTSKREAINLGADLHGSPSPSHTHTLTHTQGKSPAPSGSYAGPSSVLVTCRGERRDGHYALLRSRSLWCGAGACLLNTLQCPRSHERRWWNKFDIRARTGNFCSARAAATRTTVSKVTFPIATEILHG